MRIDLHNFFKHYNDDLKHHREAIDQLEAALEALEPALLDDSAEWVKTYRNKARAQARGS